LLSAIEAIWRVVRCGDGRGCSDDDDDEKDGGGGDDDDDDDDDDGDDGVMMIIGDGEMMTMRSSGDTTQCELK